MNKFLSMLGALAMAGCVGSLEPTPPGGPGSGSPDAGVGNQASPKTLFDQNVYPIISAKCIGCHSR